MRILFLTDNFPPEVNAPASRTFEHAREWVKAGHQVTVVTGAPNFPTGKVFEGYSNKLWQREAVDGIDVVRVWTYITANEGFLKRTLDYVSFMASATVIAPFVSRADVIVATSPQFFTAVAGYLVSRTKRKPFVFEVRDLWPESIRAVGAMKNERLLNLLEKLELFLYRKADAVVCVTNAFKNNLVNRGIDAKKIDVVTNGADLSRFCAMERDEALASSLGFAGKFIAGYVGTHGMAHALDTLLEAADKLKKAGRGDIHLMLLGSGAAKAALVDKASMMRLDNVSFLDTVPKADVPRYWSLLGASIIHLRDTELFTTVIPSKLFECMAMGIPVLHGVRGESADIVEATDVGLTFPPENAQALVDQLVRLKDDEALRRCLAANGVAAAKQFDRTVLAANMLKTLQTTL